MSRYHRVAAYLAVVVVVIAVWFLLTSSGAVNRLLLASPADTLTALRGLFDDTGLLRSALLTTLGEVIVAFLIASAIGVPLGVLIGRVPLLTRAYEPLLGNLSAVPLVLLFPLLVGLLGLGGGSKIALGALYGFFPIAIASIRSGQNVDRTLETAARAMGARGQSLLGLVILPSIVPGVVAGLRVGLGLATVTVIAGEFISSFGGLGYQLAQAGEGLQTPRLFAWIVVTLGFTVILGVSMSILGYGVDRSVRR